jgi:hypothetical protein
MEKRRKKMNGEKKMRKKNYRKIEGAEEENDWESEYCKDEYADENNEEEETEIDGTKNSSFSDECADEEDGEQDDNYKIVRAEIVEDDEEEGDEFDSEGKEFFEGKEEVERRLKKVAKLIDILEFVDSCLIVGERFVRDDEEAKEVIKEIREKILNAETLLTDYLITGRMPKIQ